MKLSLSGRVRLTVPGARNGMRFFGLLVGKWAVGCMREETDACSPPDTQGHTARRSPDAISAENLAKTREIMDTSFEFPKYDIETAIGGVEPAIAAALDAVRAEERALLTNCCRNSNDAWNERLDRERARAEAVVKAAAAMRAVTETPEGRCIACKREVVYANVEHTESCPVRDFLAARAAWEAR